MRSLLPFLTIAAGAAVLVVGVWMFSPRGGFIAAGIVIAALGFGSIEVIPTKRESER